MTNSIENNQPICVDPNTQRPEITKGVVFKHLWFYWRLAAKAKKINKRIKMDPNFYSEEYRYNWLHKKARKLLKTLNIKIDVVDVENWIDRGCILVANHQSNVDPVAIFAINDFFIQQPCAFLAKKELWEKSFSERFVNMIDCVPIDRSNPRNALQAFNEAKVLITKYKRSFVIFPEGTRSRRQEINDFHAAAVKIGQMAYAPIIPVTIIDSYKASRKDRPKNLRIKVIFGKPMNPEKFITIKTEMLAENVKREIQKNMDKYVNWDPNNSKNKIIKKDRKSGCTFYKAVFD